MSFASIAKDSHKLHLVILAVLLSIVGPIRGAEWEFLFPILTHVGIFGSTMFMLNPSEWSVRYVVEGHRPNGGRVSVNATMAPNSMKGFSPHGEFRACRGPRGKGDCLLRPRIQEN